MLFSDTKSDKLRDHLILMVEAAILCMRILETPGIQGSIRTKEAHKALYGALEHVIEDNIATSFEFAFMLDQVCRKIQPLIVEDKLTMATHSDINL